MTLIDYGILLQVVVTLIDYGMSYQNFIQEMRDICGFSHDQVIPRSIRVTDPHSFFADQGPAFLLKENP